MPYSCLLHYALYFLLFIWISNRTLVMLDSSNHMLWVNCYFHIIFLSVKQNLSHAWLLEPHALGKLILHIIDFSVKQNLNHVWLLKPHTLGKLILLIIWLSIKWSLGHVRFYKAHALRKLILNPTMLSNQDSHWSNLVNRKLLSIR